MDPEIGILWTGLQQQHGMLAIGAEAIGQYAAGRSGADDDVIEFDSIARRAGCSFIAHLLFSLLPWQNYFYRWTSPLRRALQFHRLQTKPAKQIHVLVVFR